ncbi:glycosyltransferase family 4 protein [Hymenobacter arizonensis]|uniref:Glycosyl transferases group 1 n=1 Tax=Hymenobacter arizonensis TaxID=1227077 RepID=A0A1I6BRR3_HYMAR|nr:glycosyltransferase family 4 protein [Hymenobacter arizonensis]SFQ83603.1 Glycosyl transferases group 1 [Hymenobacter arizonensis]
MQVLLHHPTGNANVRAAASGLQQAGLLAGFRTTIAAFPDSMLGRVSALPRFGELSRRHFEAALKVKTQMWPWRELGRMAASKAGFDSLVKHETGFFCVDAVYHSLDRHVAVGLSRSARRQKVDTVYAYEDGALASFQRAKQLGLTCVYDLPIGYWRAAQRLLKPEQQRWPDWAPTLTGLQDSEAKLARKDEELRLADRILVASQFTAHTLQDFPGVLAPIQVVPYGFPAVGKPRQYLPIGNGRPLKLLFVGGLSQRKGIADLFTAVAALKSRVELTIVGRKASNYCPSLDAALACHRWLPSLPHAEVLAIMREHDVLVFPSLFEGFGLVITEAMSQGTPVITTDRTAGPDLIEHGRNGWLVEAGSTAALQGAIENLLQRPESIAEAGRAAQETARGRPWAVYGQELAKALTNQP